MPKQRKPSETFNEWVGEIVERHMRTARMTQETLAERIDLAPTLMGRSIRGSRPFTVNEFERAAAVIATKLKKPDEDKRTLAATMLQEALDEYGGMDKFLSENIPPVPVSDPSPTVNDLDQKRAEKEKRLKGEEWDEGSEQSAANHDIENEQPEPEAT